MNLYVILYHHKHGVTPCVVNSKSEPTDEEMKAALEDIGEELSDFDEEREYLEAVLVGPAKEPELNRKECDGPFCPGWGIFNNNEIQRCDVCARFRSDEEAVAYAKSLEAIDVGRHLDAAAQRALAEVRDELSAVVEEVSTNPEVSAKKLMDRLEVLLGRSMWLERHRWSEHATQFARLLSELYALGEEVEDAETMRKPGYFTVKIADLEKSMDLSRSDIISIFERADAVFQSDKPEVKR